jgi:hypothetical protein
MLLQVIVDKDEKQDFLSIQKPFLGTLNFVRKWYNNEIANYAATTEAREKIT